MKLALFSATPDLLVNWNQGITIVVPVPGGKLANLAQLADGEERDLKGWLFADAAPTGNPQLAGSNADADKFVALCHRFGIVAVHATNLHVPFTGPLHGTGASKYLSRMLNRVRTDQPPWTTAEWFAVTNVDLQVLLDMDEWLHKLLERSD